MSGGVRRRCVGGSCDHRIYPIGCLLGLDVYQHVGNFFRPEVEALAKRCRLPACFEPTGDFLKRHECEFLVGFGIEQSVGGERLINPFHPERPILGRPEGVEFLIDGHGGDLPDTGLHLFLVFPLNGRFLGAPRYVFLQSAEGNARKNETGTVGLLQMVEMNARSVNGVLLDGAVADGGEAPRGVASR